MLEGVAGQGGVVGLDVELEILLQAVGAEEGDAAGDVEIVLVLGRLLRLRLDEELALEPDLLGMGDRHVEEGREVVLLAFQVGVEEGFIPLAAAPEDVVLAVQLEGDLERLLHLRGGVGEDMGIGIGGRARHVAGVGEEIGGAPEELHAGRLLQLLGMGDDLVEVAVRLGEGAALGGDVAVVEGVEGGSDLGEELEGGVHPVLGDGDGVLALFPGTDDGAGAEGIGAGSAEGVPIGDGEAEMVLEGLAVDHLVGIVVAEGERGGGAGALVGDAGNLGEVGFAHGTGFIFHSIGGQIA